MADSFDPYYKWLGISPQEQPPNHYRLLAINLFESDPDVIEAAADRQMTHLRSYQTGRHSADSQKLLNECAAARVTLLNPEKKAEYDGQLRDKSVPRARPLPRPQPSPQTTPAPFIDVGAPSSAGRFSTHRHKNKPAWLIPAAGVGGAIALALVMWIALAPSGPSDSKNRQPKTVAASSPRTSVADASRKQAATAPVNEAAVAASSFAPPTPPALSDSALADTSPRSGSITTAVDDAGSHHRQDDNHLDLVLAPGVTAKLVKIPASANGNIKSFYLGQTEVTEAQWAAVMGGQSEHPSLPKVDQTFTDWKRFLEKISEAPGMRFRLRPSTGDEAQFVTGDESKYGLDATWCLENSGRKPQSVATAKPNEFELFDIIGNAWEFCEGGFIFGTCFTTPEAERGYRIHMPGDGDPNFKAPDVGFRIAADLLTTPSDEIDGSHMAADIPSREPGEKTSTAENPPAASPVGGHSELKKQHQPY